MGQRAYPDARTFASPGVRERAAKKKPAIQFDEDLGDDAPHAWQEDIAQVILHGGRFMEEVVFFHLASKTLIVTDIIENFEREKLPWYFRPLARVAGVLAPRGGTPRDYRATYRGNHDTLRPAIDTILSWDPVRIILAHGMLIEDAVPKRLQEVFAWAD